MRLANVLLAGEPRLVLAEDGTGLQLVSDPGGQPIRSTDELFQRQLDVASLPRTPLAAREEDLVFLPVVVRPEKVVCVGRNYLAHVEQEGAEVPAAPCLFAKFPSTLAGHGAVVTPPKGARQLDYEGELAVIVGRKAKDVPEEEALRYVFGYAVANDLSARDLQFLTPQWLSGKAPDGFCPIGPWLVTQDEVPDPQALSLRTWRGGKLVQDSHTSRMIFPVRHLLSYISRLITLRPGDIVLTGTPEGVEYGKEQPDWLKTGEIVEVEVERLGRLRSVIGPVS